MSQVLIGGRPHRVVGFKYWYQGRPHFAVKPIEETGMPEPWRVEDLLPLISADGQPARMAPAWVCWARSMIPDDATRAELEELLQVIRVRVWDHVERGTIDDEPACIRLAREP